MRNVYLIWLEWPEKCFRVDTEALRFLRSLAPRGARIVRTVDEAGFLKSLSAATHVITWHFKKEWYDLAPRLKVLATPGAGRELVAWSDAPEGVVVHFGGFHGAIIAESVIGFMFAWAHGFFRPELAAADKKGAPWAKSWPRALLGDKCSLVAGSRAVIVGYGRIGRAIGCRLESLGVEVEGFSRRNIGGLDRAAQKADWLILALPSDTGTDDFLDAKLIAKLPLNCVVVNIGRGNAVDEAALLDALRSGRLAGAYLDVFHNEPGPLNKAGSASRGGILAMPKSKLPWSLVRMPHSSAFCSGYLKMCFEELKDDGLL